MHLPAVFPKSNNFYWPATDFVHEIFKFSSQIGYCENYQISWPNFSDLGKLRPLQNFNLKL